MLFLWAHLSELNSAALGQIRAFTEIVLEAQDTTPPMRAMAHKALEAISNNLLLIEAGIELAGTIPAGPRRLHVHGIPGVDLVAEDMGAEADFADD